MNTRKNIMNIKVSTKRLDKVYNIYKDKKKLGKGTFGIVVEGEDKATGQIRAIKIIKKEKIEEADMELLANEFNIMLEMDHPNIVKLYEVYEDPKYLYFVMELLEGKNLYDSVVGNENMSEEKIRELFFQIVKGIQYLHKNGIAHRDIKPENIMYVNKKSDKIKLIDFGISKYFFNKENPTKEITLRTKAGSLYYISPEVIEGAYDAKTDIWSAGVILYILVSGVPPFYDINPRKVVEKVKNIEYGFKEEVWQTVSPELKDLLSHLLAKKDVRYNADKVLEHPWMKKDMKEKIFQIDLNSMRNFFFGCKLAKVVREMITASSSETDSKNVGNFFVDMDEDGDGLIKREELIEGIKRNFQFNDTDLIEQIEKTYKSDQLINYNNFLAAVSTVMNYSNFEKRIEKAFQILDVKGKGKITPTDLKVAFKNMGYQEGSEEKRCEEMIKEIDKKNKGYLDLGDFKAMLKF